MDTEIKEHFGVNPTDVYKRSHIVAKMVSAFAEINPGTLITWEAILDMTQTSSIARARGFMSEVRRRLVAQHGVFLESERKTGYRRVMPGREADMVLGKFESGQKRCRIAVMESKCIRVDQLAMAERTVAIEKLSHLRGLAGLYLLGGQCQQAPA